MNNFLKNKGIPQNTIVAIASILGTVLVLEGGYVNNPNDPGGATNWGITEKVARENGYTGNMRNLKKEDAIAIYTKQYAHVPGFIPLVQHSKPVGEKLITSGVNVGTSRSSCWLQKSLNDFSRNGQDYPKIAEDCKIGNATINAYKKLEKKRGKVLACQLTVKALDTYQGNHYLTISRSNPKLSTFTVGWFSNRIGDVSVKDCNTLK